MKTNKLKTLFVVVSSAIVFGTNAQIFPVQSWGTGGSGTASSTSVSARYMGSNEFYTCGVFTGTADLNPDAGIFNVSTTTIAGFVTKNDLLTGYQWGFKMDGVRFIKIIHTDDAIYLCGTFAGTVDFDPLAGVSNVTSNGTTDIFLLKLTLAANFLWVRTFGGSGDDVSSSMDLGINSNGLDAIYLTGTYSNTVDFNPLAGVYNATSNGGIDCFVEKINEDGSFGWARTFGGPYEDNARDIDVRDVATDEIHIIGDFQGLVDFNPTLGIFNLSTGLPPLSKAIFILKLAEPGGFTWAKKLDKTSNSGGFPTFGYTIASDAFDGSIYCGGVFETGTPFDFDPDTGGQFLVTGTSAASNAFLLKLNQNGEFTWVRTFVPTVTDVVPHDIDVLTGATGPREIYTIGFMLGSVNFNLGDGPIGVLNSTTGSPMFVTRHESDGSFKWAKQPQGGSTSSTLAGWHSIQAFDHGGYARIWFTGSLSSSQIDMNPEPNVYILNNNNPASSDGFVTQWNESLSGKTIKSLSTSGENDLDLYPNPSNQLINITIKDKLVSDIEITSLAGAVLGLDVLILDSKLQIDFSNQQSGIYIIKYFVDGELQIDRVSIVK